MISVSEARRLILEATPRGEVAGMPLADAAGLYLANPVAAHYPLPLFDNSAMDGYALRAADVADATEDHPVRLAVCGTAAAGPIDKELRVGAGEAARIFTGAPVPGGATAVVRQEDVTAANAVLTIRAGLDAGTNIRRRGEEVQPGDILLDSGQRLNPAALGLLAGAGCRNVEVVKPPTVALVVTGSEIVTDGSDLIPGQIFESNSYGIRAAVDQTGALIAGVSFAGDERVALRDTMEKAAASSDFLLITGGVSVGDFDYVKEIAGEMGYDTLLWKVRQKPGKPLFVAVSPGGKLLFGLPGNPASALVCFYEYVRPALLKLMGAANVMLPALMAPLIANYHKKGTLTQFLKGRLSHDGTVAILDHQGSHMMSSFARANCLIVIPEDCAELKAGAPVEVHLLPI